LPEGSVAVPREELRQLEGYACLGREIDGQIELLRSTVGGTIRPGKSLITEGIPAIVAEVRRLKVENERLGAENADLRGRLEEYKGAYPVLSAKYHALAAQPGNDPVAVAFAGLLRSGVEIVARSGESARSPERS
jgi:hypothetical protein